MARVGPSECRGRFIGGSAVDAVELLAPRAIEEEDEDSGEQADANGDGGNNPGRWPIDLCDGLHGQGAADDGSDDRRTPGGKPSVFGVEFLVGTVSQFRACQGHLLI